LCSFCFWQQNYKQKLHLNDLAPRAVDPTSSSIPSALLSSSSTSSPSTSTPSSLTEMSSKSTSPQQSQSDSQDQEILPTISQTVTQETASEMPSELERDGADGDAMNVDVSDQETHVSETLTISVAENKLIEQDSSSTVGDSDVTMTTESAS
jgi:hypothetical protein